MGRLELFGMWYHTHVTWLHVLQFVGTFRFSSRGVLFLQTGLCNLTMVILANILYIIIYITYILIQSYICDIVGGFVNKLLD